ncbi:uncharacterized protein TNCV_3856211 [Trichonephila clavipes]|nr:uncharacterized protein TNCV_3856211 [Trichonephila clavipes]
MTCTPTCTLRRPYDIEVRDTNCGFIGHWFEGMDVCKCIVPSRHGSTLNSHRDAIHIVRLVKREKRGEIPDHPQGVHIQNWDGIKQTRTVTCIVLKAMAKDRLKKLVLS